LRRTVPGLREGCCRSVWRSWRCCLSSRHGQSRDEPVSASGHARVRRGIGIPRDFSSLTMVRGISPQPQTFACAMCHLTRCSSRAFLGIGCLACHLALSVGISVILYERLRSALASINVATITLLSSMLAGCAMTHNARHQHPHVLSMSLYGCAQTSSAVIAKSARFTGGFAKGGGLKNRRLRQCKMSMCAF
jgi:hypothetical protein